MSAQMPKSLRIDFVSDVVCPWCAIGLASLEQALRQLQGEVAADLHFQPFELDPTMPAGGADVAETLKRKYGMSDAQLMENQARLRDRGAELGFTLLHGAQPDLEHLRRAPPAALGRGGIARAPVAVEARTVGGELQRRSGCQRPCGAGRACHWRGAG